MRDLQVMYFLLFYMKKWEKTTPEKQTFLLLFISYSESQSARVILEEAEISKK